MTVCGSSVQCIAVRCIAVRLLLRQVNVKNTAIRIDPYRCIILHHGIKGCCCLILLSENRRIFPTFAGSLPQQAFLPKLMTLQLLTKSPRLGKKLMLVSGSITPELHQAIFDDLSDRSCSADISCNGYAKTCVSHFS
jgi:hypothetical protein